MTSKIVAYSLIVKPVAHHCRISLFRIEDMPFWGQHFFSFIRIFILFYDYRSREREKEVQTDKVLLYWFLKKNVDLFVGE